MKRRGIAIAYMGAVGAGVTQAAARVTMAVEGRNMTTPAEPLLPLRADDIGILRVASTRVPFDNLIHEFLRGATPEEIVTAYPTVSLADVYTLIGYYLRNCAELDEYLAKNRAATTAAVERGRRQQAGLRERLLARLNARENSGAAVPGG